MHPQRCPGFRFYFRTWDSWVGSSNTIAVTLHNNAQCNPLSACLNLPWKARKVLRKIHSFLHQFFLLEPFEHSFMFKPCNQVRRNQAFKEFLLSPTQNLFLDQPRTFFFGLKSIDTDASSEKSFGSREFRTRLASSRRFRRPTQDRWRWLFGFRRKDKKSWVPESWRFWVNRSKSGNCQGSG